MNEKQEKLAALAQMLGHPAGEQAVALGQHMHAHNFNMTKNAIDLLDIPANSDVLELGHGNAHHLSYFHDQLPTAAYTGLEIATAMQQEAIAFAQQLPPLNAKFDLYDGKLFPYQDQQFNAVFAVNNLYFWTKPQLTFQEIHRVLKPGGMLVLSVGSYQFMKSLPFTSYGFRLYREEALENLLRRNNFKLTKVVKIIDEAINKLGDPVTRTFLNYQCIKN